MDSKLQEKYDAGFFGDNDAIAESAGGCPVVHKPRVKPTTRPTQARAQARAQARPREKNRKSL